MATLADMVFNYMYSYIPRRYIFVNAIWTICRLCLSKFWLHLDISLLLNHNNMHCAKGSIHIIMYSQWPRCWSYSFLRCLFYEAICFKSCLVLFVLMFFSPLSIAAITSLGEERANLSAFRMFIRFALVWFCLFPLPLGVWEGLRLVNVALSRLFSFLFSEYSPLVKLIIKS